MKIPSLTNWTRSSRAHRTVRPALVVAGLIFLVMLTAIIYAEIKLSQLVLGGLGESFSTKIYSAPTLINDQIHESPDQLLLRLQRLKYRAVEVSSVTLGEYFWTPPALTVYLHEFRSPIQNQESGTVVLTATKDNQWTIKTATGDVVSQIALEPELLSELSGTQKVRREPMSAEEIPPDLIKAVVAAEDKRFFSHWGVDWLAVAHAAWLDIVRHKKLLGGSTITQQLVKNIFLNPKRTLRRKITEAFLAIYLELRMSKNRILTIYLNHIYMGQDGPVSVAGMKAASKFYFGKDLSSLNTAECAALAGIIRSPYLYNPFRSAPAAKARRDQVLQRMFFDGMLSQQQLSLALATRLKTRAYSPQETQDENAYVIAEVTRQLLPRYSEETLFRYGLNIYTTIDPLMQKKAQNILRDNTQQGALVALNPWTGGVLALTGGKDFKESQFNRATQALRQPGSAFKPFVYGAALEKGFTPASILEDKPKKYRGGFSRTWRPENYDGVYRGTTTLRLALAHSLNAATLNLAERLGTDAIIDFARKCGIESPLDKNLTLALGSSEVSLMELTAAYAPFANGGFTTQPHLIDAVSDADGNILEYRTLERKSVMDPAIAYLITSLLQSTIQEGTAKALSQWGWTRPSAGKTGTTNEGKDAWFIGYTPQIMTGVWVGDDQSRAIHVFGAKDALPLWASFMHYALEDYPPTPFIQPQGLISVMIDPQSGLLAVAGCPARRQEFFISGTQPTQYCNLHESGIKGWFKRIFGKS